MYNLTILSYGLLLVISSSLVSCLNEPVYPNTPQIEFKGFSRYILDAGTGVGQQKRDSLIITIGFKDGDGDLGNNLPLSSTDSTRYKQAGGAITGFARLD